MAVFVYKGSWHSGKHYRYQLLESKQNPLDPFSHVHAHLEKELLPSFTGIAFWLQLPHHNFHIDALDLCDLTVPPIFFADSYLLLLYPCEPTAYVQTHEHTLMHENHCSIQAQWTPDHITVLRILMYTWHYNMHDDHKTLNNLESTPHLKKIFLT